MANEDFASDLVDSTMDVLRDQDDAQQIEELTGIVTFNPSVFQPEQPDGVEPRRFVNFREGDNRFLVLGPYRFDRRFAKPPTLVFGEIEEALTNTGDNPIVVGIPTAYIPFRVDADPYQWVYANGEVDGFYVGLYALTVPPLGLISHSVTYYARGDASRYTVSDSSESWTQSYDMNTADYLESDNTGSPDEELDNTDDFV